MTDKTYKVGDRYTVTLPSTYGVFTSTGPITAIHEDGTLEVLVFDGAHPETGEHVREVVNVNPSGSDETFLSITRLYRKQQEEK